MKKRNIALTFLESIYGALTPEKTEQASKVQQQYQSFRAKARSQRNMLEQMADSITAFFGSISFAILHIFWFAAWIYINTGQAPWLAPFDPFPFGLLTMIVSLEAIFLSVFVLISQNRETQITDLRQEIDFHINKQSEEEVTKLLEMVHDIYVHLGLEKKPDIEIEKMKKKIDQDRIEEEIRNEEKG